MARCSQWHRNLPPLAQTLWLGVEHVCMKPEILRAILLLSKIRGEKQAEIHMATSSPKSWPPVRTSCWRRWWIRLRNASCCPYSGRTSQLTAPQIRLWTLVLEVNLAVPGQSLDLGPELLWKLHLPSTGHILSGQSTSYHPRRIAVDEEMTSVSKCKYSLHCLQIHWTCSQELHFSGW